MEAFAPRTAGWLGGYLHPRGAMAREIAGGLGEGRALAQLFLACGLGFLASLPGAVRAARGLSIEDPVAGAVSAHLFGYFFVAPILAYGLAALAHLAARLFGGRGGFLGARVALFRALLLVAPVALVIAAAGMVAEAAGWREALPLLSIPGYAGLVLWMWVFAARLAEAEGFASAGRVALVLGAFLGGIGMALVMLAPGSPPAN